MFVMESCCLLRIFYVEEAVRVPLDVAEKTQSDAELYIKQMGGSENNSSRKRQMQWRAVKMKRLRSAVK